jgi:asparagine synthase (glutamine-hydrolysing)
MSGIVGIVNRDGAPVDRELLRSMVDFMAYRGPDSQTTWSEGSVGFGHALLATTPEHARERQPCTLDGQVWITADARVDGQADLMRELAGRGRDGLADATDAELILHAYHAWGEDCVGHLLGDFAFAVWDGPRRRLFCARDHFGIKPFFYALRPDCLAFSNTLNCVRLHPAVSAQFDDLAIGDFLLFGMSYEPAATTFADIRRLPPAHALIWSDGELRLRRYWTVPTDEEVRYKRNSDYVDHFRELLRTAVQDRLRTNRVTVMMSGGIDSPAVAATAQQLLKEQGTPFELSATTTVFDRLIPDRERHYSGLVARHLGLPIHYLVGDDCQYLERLGEIAAISPEPSGNLFAPIFEDLMERVAAQGRVTLTGYDGDAPLGLSLKAHWAGLLKTGQWPRLAAELGWYAWVQYQVPPVNLRGRVRRLLVRSRPEEPGLPRWLDSAFASRLDLTARWAQRHRAAAVGGPPARAPAYRLLQLPGLQHGFEAYDPGRTRLPVEARHVLLDVRLVSFLLAVPPVPWCFKKWLPRAAVRGVLPEVIRRRPKSPMAGDPVALLFRREGPRLISRFEPTPQLRAYVDVPEWRRVAAVATTSDEYWPHVYPLCLNHWFCSLLRRTICGNAGEVSRHGRGSPCPASRIGHPQLHSTVTSPR